MKSRVRLALSVRCQLQKCNMPCLKGYSACLVSSRCVPSFYHDYVGKVLPLLDDDDFLTKGAPTPLAAGTRKGRK
jgi:hypothetical protein